MSTSEIPLTLVLAKMEHNGVAIDCDYLKELSSYMTEKLAELEDLIYQLAGDTFNINSPRQVAYELFDNLKIKTKKKKSRSTSAEVLEELAQDYEICDYILQHRKFSKLKSTYTDVFANAYKQARQPHSHDLQSGSYCNRASFVFQS